MAEEGRQTCTLQVDAIEIFEKIMNFHETKKANFKIEKVISEDFDTITISFDSGCLSEVFYLGSLYGSKRVHDDLGLTYEQYKELKFKNKGVY